jgi:MFS family permease
MVLMVAYAFSFVDRQILNLMVGPIRADLQLSDTQVSLLQGLAFALFYTFCGIPLGALADRVHRPRLIAAGVALWSLMTAACGLARSFGSLFLARVGVGIGEAALSPPAYSMIADLFSPERRGRAASVYYMGVQFGSALALLVGGPAVELLGRVGTIEVPVLGTLAPWQAAFMVVGLPGLLVAAVIALLRDPRPGRAKPSPGGPARAGARTADLIAHLRRHRGAYLGHFAGFSVLSLVAYGIGAWAPSFMIRTYGWGPGKIGIFYGILTLTVGTTGVYAGGWLADWLRKRGHVDATLRAAYYGAVAIWIPAIVSPLMPTDTLAMVLAVPMTFLLGFPFGVAGAAIQEITPPALRGRATALYLFSGTLIGLGAGPTVFALVTDHVFRNDQMLRYSLSLVPALLIPVAALILRGGLKPFRAAVQER